MSCLGNVVWLICGGLVTSVAYVVGGLLMCLTVVGIPFGLQAIKLGFANLTPFGKNVVESGNSSSTINVLLNVLWLVLFGWEIAVTHLVHAGLLAITIVGIPFAVQHVKLIPLALFPFGHDLAETRDT